MEGNSKKVAYFTTYYNTENEYFDNKIVTLTNIKECRNLYDTIVLELNDDEFEDFISFQGDIANAIYSYLKKENVIINFWRMGV